MRNIFLALWIMLLLPSGLLNAAAIRLDNVIVHFEEGTKSKKDIEVANTSQETAYVEVTVYDVNNPGEANESIKEITDPKEISLLVSPNKVVIPPNGRTFLRLVNLETPKEKEKVYRLKVAPVEGDGEAQHTGVRILIAYGVLIFVEPENPSAELTYEKNGKKITFKNLGNTNVLLTNGLVCKKGSQVSDQESECEKLESRRMYAGNTWVLEIPFEGEVSFNAASRMNNEKIIIE